uniref:Uncharacterized protein n=1 Tax=viral metagenome TaxID=1070528 RepID=A0A6C0BBA8_9ZZZZ
MKQKTLKNHRSCTKYNPLKGCRLVKGKKETCCINPRRGFWCWSKRTKRRISKCMKRECCKRN